MPNDTTATCALDGCTKVRKKKGKYCAMHYSRWWRYGSWDAPSRFKPVEDRFWPKVEKTESCWLWIGGLRSNGYGNFSTETGRSVLAHRFAYELLVGPIADGLHLDHLCRVPRCVNPAHLEPVTCQENILRGVAPSAVSNVTGWCGKGLHRLEGDNLYVNPSGRQQCRECTRERQRRGYYRRKAAA